MTTPAVPTARPEPAAPCPCGSGQAFGQCCAPVIGQQRPAATAEQLMRSRFTAHFIGDYRHLHRTYLETSRRPYVDDVRPDDVLAWSRLVIHSHEPGPRPDVAYVDFTAYFRHGDTEQALPEKSEFSRIDGQWFYVRSVRTGPAPVKAAAKVGRNDPCPCGSGRKHKQCCLAA